MQYKNLFLISLAFIYGCNTNQSEESTTDSQLSYLYLQDPADDKNIFESLDTSFLGAIAHRFEESNEQDSLQALARTYDFETGTLREQAKADPKINKLLMQGNILAMGSPQQTSTTPSNTLAKVSIDNSGILIKTATGEFIPTNEYGFRYRIHAQTYGWTPYIDRGSLGWTDKRVEAIEWTTPGVQGKAHVAEYGTSDWKNTGERLGTVGLSNRIVAVWFRTVSGGQGFIQYRINYIFDNKSVFDNGKWGSWKYEGQQCGDIGKAIGIDKIGIYRMKFGNGNACSRPGEGVCQGF